MTHVSTSSPLRVIAGGLMIRMNGDKAGSKGGGPGGG